MAPALDFYFDFSCPFAYLASTQIESLAKRTGAELRLRPVLLGGVFKAIGQEPNLAATLGPSRAKHNLNDMRRFAAFHGVTLKMPAGHPLRTVEALRALLAAGEPFLPLAHRFYRAYWVDGVNISTPEGVTRVLTEAGLDASKIIARAATPEIKDELRRRTDEAVQRGVFGVPAISVDGDPQLYFGQDRLGFVEEALGGNTSPVILSYRPGDYCAPVDFWFDYASPFTYLAAERVELYFGEHARWRPLLIGGLFKTVGQVQVPLFAMSESKRRISMADLVRQAKRYDIPFTYPQKFPMNTVLPLRVTLAAEIDGVPADKVREMSRRIFRAYWAQGRDISEPAIISEVASSVGLDGSKLVLRAADAPVKDELRNNTEEAAVAGAFGAPTFVVSGSGEDAPALFWGGDRLELAALAARGDRRVF
jgi:2-hydroxychromene-2-carboxylate isomerase